MSSIDFFLNLQSTSFVSIVESSEKSLDGYKCRLYPKWLFDPISESDTDVGSKIRVYLTDAVVRVGSSFTSFSFSSNNLRQTLVATSETLIERGKYQTSGGNNNISTYL